MAFRGSLHFLSVSLFCLVVLFFTSCEKFSGDQSIPSYVKIDSIGFSTIYSQQGSSSHSITDAWVYADGDFIGTFPLPANFPVLKKGTHTLTIYPGIKKDGIAATRVSYPFYGSIEKTINLVPDQENSVGLISTVYSSEAKFLWLEDFETSTISLDTTKRSSVNIVRSSPGSDLTNERQYYCGKIEMDTTGDFFECTSHQDFTVPSAPVYLELDFNTNNVLTVGLMIYTGSVKYQTSVVDLADTHGKWKKIYIDLSNGINAYTGATLFQVVFGAYKESDVATARIYLDNIKLLTTTSGKKN
jgi:hypothetical protein